MSHPGDTDDSPPTASVVGSDRASRRRERTQVFKPGDVLAGRYRIVSLLGRGGMGEVYRADDLTLGQTVALKFIAADLSSDSAIERFRAEVRLARQVSHPNICRVFDIVEWEGRHFLTMEYIDGEDLASLLRRIGRLPHDKAVQIAQQLCAGLSAAHEIGVIHRDIKPANIMLDGRGRARLTDFGVAAAVEDLGGGDTAIAGTPAYMAPEQLRDGRVSRRSDLYSLGLVLYEIFTGKPALTGSTVAELRRTHEHGSSVLEPSRLVADLDPIVERAILRCLESDPSARPASATALAAALPGGDPVAAALAAGETPSPEMVAASGDRASWSPWVASVLALTALLFTGLTLFFAAQATTTGRSISDRPAPVLIEDARRFLAQLGYEDRLAHSAYGVTDYSLSAPPGSTVADHLPGLEFWLRESPSAFSRWAAWAQPGIASSHPPLVIMGERRVMVHPDGHLVSLVALPTGRDDQNEPSVSTPEQVLALMGLDPSRFARSTDESPLVPLHLCDRIELWIEQDESIDAPLRVTIGWYKGRINTIFQRRASAETVYAPSPPQTIAQRLTRFIGFVFTIVLFVVPAVTAWFNLKRGRSDRRTAFRVAVLCMACLASQWLLVAWDLFPPDSFSINRMFSSVAGTTLISWLIYLSIEPLVRREIPGVLISWTRLFAGRLLDPLVGKAVLVGLTVATALSATLLGAIALLGLEPITHNNAYNATPNHLGWALSTIPGAVVMGLLVAGVAGLMLGIGRIILRKKALAAIFAGLIVGLASPLTPIHPPLGELLSAAFCILLTFAVLRYGLVAGAIAVVVIELVVLNPFTPSTSGPFWTYTVIASGVLLALTGWGWYASCRARLLPASSASSGPAA